MNIRALQAVQSRISEENRDLLIITFPFKTNFLRRHHFFHKTQRCGTFEFAASLLTIEPTPMSWVAIWCRPYVAYHTTLTPPYSPVETSLGIICTCRTLSPSLYNDRVGLLKLVSIIGILRSSTRGSVNNPQSGTERIVPATYVYHGVVICLYISSSVTADWYKRYSLRCRILGIYLRSISYIPKRVPVKLDLCVWLTWILIRMAIVFQYDVAILCLTYSMANTLGSVNWYEWTHDSIRRCWIVCKRERSLPRFI